MKILEWNIQPDHVHTVMRIPPKYAISNFMSFPKGKLALRLFNKYEHSSRRYWGCNFWSCGYRVSTVGLDEDEIRHYEKRQEQQERQAEESPRAKIFALDIKCMLST